MKKFYFLLCLLATSLAGIGQQLFFEPFNYTPDATNGLFTQSAGLWTRINTGDSILVTSGSLTYPGLAASTGNKVSYDNAGADYYTSFTSQTTGTVYGSFILNISSITATTSGGYFTSFIQDASTSSFGGAVWVRSGTTAGKYNIGISTRSNSTVSWLTNELDPGTSYFIVFAYEMIAGAANDVAKIWLNTTAIGGTEPAPDATAVPSTIDLTSVARVLLRQDNTTNMPFFVQLDEYRIGTTWASVTPGNAPSASLSATTLTGFGNTCVNTTSAANSFTITGTNLTTADVTVSGPAGYSFSTTSGGTYTNTLNLTQPGGAFSQVVYVKFSPTAVQSYNGDIVVAGGGASSINVAATGSGVNAAPAVTTGAATSVSTNAATVAGTITDPGCTAVIAYGIEYSLTSGFANGTGTQVPSTNLSGTGFTSALGGLTPGTTYYYKAYATNAAGTTYGTEQSFTTSSLAPTITATALTGFGNVCVNTTSIANTFTINGTNLTNASVTVGPLAGFAFSTTAGGTFTSTLTLAQPGGTYAQQIFVQFNPTAIQSYNGNIPVAGGGTAAPTDVAVTGAGVNSAPSVTTGNATAITTTTATAAGTINNQGCSAVTAYGIEYSTVNNFANGTGTQVASANLTGTGFTSALSGLTPSTTYYFKAYATNGGGTNYGSQQSFTTAAPPPAALTATTLTAFGNSCINTTAGPNSFTINGVNLTNANITVGPLAGYSFSTSANGTYTPSLSIPQTGGTFSQVVYVKFTPTAVQAYNGNIPVGGGGATSINVAASGTGTAGQPVVVTDAASSITTNTAVLSGTISSQGCSNITEYGFEYSGIDNFIPGTGTKLVAGSGISTGSFSANATGLVQGTTYYFRSYATNVGGTSYGAQQSFTVQSIPNGLTVYPNPARIGREMNFSLNNLGQGFVGLEIYNLAGQQVYRKNFNIQNNFINDRITIPYSLPVGIYALRFVNDTKVLETKTVFISY